MILVCFETRTIYELSSRTYTLNEIGNIVRVGDIFLTLKQIPRLAGLAAILSNQNENIKRKRDSIPLMTYIL